MDRKSLMKEWPKNAQDAEGAAKLLSHGYPTLKPVLPDIVEWVKTNGAVANLFCEFLSANGEHALEPVCGALKGTHDSQILRLLCEVMPRWPRSALLASAHELEMLLQRGSVFGLNVYALRLLVDVKAKTHAPVEEWAGLFRRRLNEQLAVLDAIDSQLSENK